MGARVGGGLLGGFGLFLVVLFGWGSSNWWIALPFHIVFAFMIVRPWFLGVLVGPGTVLIRSWFRNYALTAADVATLEIVKYSGLVGFAVGWIPFVGRVAMIEVETPDGRFRWFPATFNRRNRTLRIVREMRVALAYDHGPPATRSVLGE